MKRTFKYYLKLSGFQKRKLDRMLELCHWLHNFLLEKFRIRDKKGEQQPSKHQLINSLPKIKKNYSFLKEVHSSNLQEVAKEVYQKWQNYRKIKKMDDKKGYPKFKPSHRYNSFTYSKTIEKNGCGYKIDNSPLSEKKDSRKLKIVLGNQNHHRVYLDLKLVMERKFQGQAKTLTIKRKNNRYYALFSCDGVKERLLPRTNKSIGIDVNLNKQSYITLSDGKKYKHPQYYKKAEKQLIKIQRKLSRKIKGSNNWLDTELQMAKKWEKVVNQFKHYAYQIANKLTKEYDNIAIEDLRIRSMINDKLLSKHIQQARWGILFKVIAEEAEIATRQLVRVNPRNTTRTCSDCGELSQEKVKLNQRTFNCWNCDNELDRDVNSARNILNRAITENRFDQNLPLNKENNF